MGFFFLSLRCTVKRAEKVIEKRAGLDLNDLGRKLYTRRMKCVKKELFYDL
jgi:hypothetical protein